MKSRAPKPPKLMWIATLLLLAHPSEAVVPDGDSQLWFAGFARFQLSEKFLGFAEIQNRLSEHASREQRLLVRVAGGVRLSERITLWLGYGWTPEFNPAFLDEHRIWQQVLSEHEWGNWRLSARFRLEERILAGASSIGWRWREMLRLSVHPAGYERVGIVMWDEFFFSMSRNEVVVTGGLDQNRLFIGLNKTIYPGMSLDAGYLNLQTKQAAGNWNAAHAVVVYYYYHQPPRIAAKAD